MAATTASVCSARQPHVRRVTRAGRRDRGQRGGPQRQVARSASRCTVPRGPNVFTSVRSVHSASLIVLRVAPASRSASECSAADCHLRVGPADRGGHVGGPCRRRGPRGRGAPGGGRRPRPRTAAAPRARRDHRRPRPVGSRGRAAPASRYAAVQVGLAYGRGRLDVPLRGPDPLVVRPQDAPRLADPAGGDRGGACARRSAARRCASWCATATASSSRSATARAPSRATSVLPVLLDEIAAVAPRARVTVVDRHGHAPRQHAGGARGHARAARCWSACDVVNHDARDDATLVDLGTHGDGVPLRAEPRVGRRRRAHHDGLRRAALLRGLQRRAEDGRAGPGGAARR